MISCSVSDALRARKSFEVVAANTCHVWVFAVSELRFCARPFYLKHSGIALVHTETVRPHSFVITKHSLELRML